jgi:hypothetical protein
MKRILHGFKITYAITGLLFLYVNSTNAKKSDFTARKVPRIAVPKTVSRYELSTATVFPKNESPKKSTTTTSTETTRPLESLCRVQSETFPTFVSSPKREQGTDVLSGWNVSGNYSGNYWDADRGFIDFDGTGLLFKRDVSTTTTMSKTVTVPKNIVLSLEAIGWVNTYDFADDPEGQSKLEIRLGGML